MSVRVITFFVYLRRIHFNVSNTYNRAYHYTYLFKLIFILYDHCHVINTFRVCMQHVELFTVYYLLILTYCFEKKILFETIINCFYLF